MVRKGRQRRKDEKTHRSGSIVESRRRAGNKVPNRHVFYLGEINDSQREAWERISRAKRHGAGCSGCSPRSTITHPHFPLRRSRLHLGHGQGRTHLPTEEILAELSTTPAPVRYSAIWSARPRDGSRITRPRWRNGRVRMYAVLECTSGTAGQTCCPASANCTSCPKTVRASTSPAPRTPQSLAPAALQSV
jgi:hypothetical protein